MADLKLKKVAARSTIIDTNTLLATTGRAAGDYDNSTNLGLLADVYLVTQYDTTAPSAGDSVGYLWVIHGDGEATEKFAEGGDGTVGTDIDPAGEHFVGAFETRSPSITTDEQMVIRDVPLGFDGNRFVFKNISGQQMDFTWQLDIVVHGLQSA